MATRKNQRSSFAITERDRLIFEFVGQHETATFDQVRRKFWPDSVTNQTARDRLDKLRKAGFLAVHQDYQPDAQSRAITRYQVRRAALTELDTERASQLYTGNLNDDEVEQAIAGVETRLVLEAQGRNVVEWVSERELKREQRRGIAVGEIRAGTSEISDGQVVEVNTTTGEIERVEVELDSGNYWGKMLREKLQKYEGRSVVWACTSSSPANVARVQRAAAAHSNINVISVF